MQLLKAAARSFQTATGRASADERPVTQRYQKVDRDAGGAEDGVFTIDDDDTDDLSIEKLSKMHSMLLNQAKDTISSTESAVLSLREERRGHEDEVRELAAVNDAARAAVDSLGAEGAQRTPCCGLRRCVIL